MKIGLEPIFDINHFNMSKVTYQERKVEFGDGTTGKLTTFWYDGEGDPQAELDKAISDYCKFEPYQQLVEYLQPYEENKAMQKRLVPSRTVLVGSDGTDPKDKVKIFTFSNDR